MREYVDKESAYIHNISWKLSHSGYSQVAGRALQNFYLVWMTKQADGIKKSIESALENVPSTPKQIFKAEFRPGSDVFTFEI